MRKAVSVMVVEDEPITLEHLCRAVDDHPAMAVLQRARTLAEARRLIGIRRPDVLVADLGLPDGSGIDLIRDVCREHDEVLVLVLSGLGDEQSVIAAIMAGAKGYLLKGGSRGAVCDGILQLADGGSPISASIARYLLVKLKQGSAPEPPPRPLLTEREVQVLELVAQGYRSSEIAERLFISYHTVVHHVRNVYDKLQVRSRSQAIYKASQIGLLKG